MFAAESMWHNWFTVCATVPDRVFVLVFNKSQLMSLVLTVNSLRVPQLWWNPESQPKILLRSQDLLEISRPARGWNRVHP